MQKVYVITLWSGGAIGKRWKTLKEPELLPNGTGVAFQSLDTKLSVRVIGSISVEEFEQGMEPGEYEIETGPKTDEGLNL